jgi:putative ubiquitin-RnfH superfamily antitoxin RatB of RatAB toxin-antitoxin module
MASDAPIRVEVCYAKADVQAVVALTLPPGTTAAEAAERSGLKARFPEIDLGKNALGVSGRRVEADRPLKDGERLEILRPLSADPKETRRRLAAAGKSMGKAKS